jgi:phage tail protein X
MNDVIYQTRDGDMLDRICWLHYTQQYNQHARIVEQVLEKNPKLSALGPIYSENVLITLPHISTTVANQSINIWD